MTFEAAKIELNEWFASQSHPLIDELSHLLGRLDFDYYEGFNKHNISALKFEYEFDSFDIVAYPLSKSYEVAGEIKILLEERPLSSSFPHQLEEGFLQGLNESERSKKARDFTDYKYEAFENWFADCWDQAKDDTRLFGFFSIHDTMWVTNLDDRKKINEQTIPNLLKQ